MGAAAAPRSCNSLSLAIALLALLSLSIAISAAAKFDIAADDDLDLLEELLAIDEASDNGEAGSASPETEAVRRAQRVVLSLESEAAAQRAIKEHPFLLVLGYAPWDDRSAALMPRFAEAVAELSRGGGGGFAFAKLDGDRFPKVAAAVGVKGYPTVLLFVHGAPLMYSGRHNALELVTWVRKKTGSPIIRLSSREGAEEFSKKHHTFLLGLFDRYKGHEYEEFKKAASADNETQFVETTDKIIASSLFPDVSSKPFIGLVKSELERFENFEGNLDAEGILQFVSYNRLPLITELTEENSAKFYASPVKLQVFVFAEADDFEYLQTFIIKVARKFKTKIIFAHVDFVEENLAKPFLTLYGLETLRPTVTAFDTNKVSKHLLLEEDVTIKNLEEFCEGLLSGTLAPYYKSETIPREKELVEKVVGRTFDASVLENSDHVFLEVYTPWCLDCESATKQVEKLASHFKGMDGLRFARIDASVNEHPKLQVNNYPALLFYPAEDKSNPIKVSKKSSVKDKIAFINEKLKATEVEAATSEDEGKKDDVLVEAVTTEDEGRKDEL